MKPACFLFAITAFTRGRLGRTILISGLETVASLAQLTHGYVSGSIADASGSVVPAVRITLQETATGVRHSGFTNEAGVYRLVGLESGVYSIEYEKAGFETVHVDGVELKTAQEVVLDQTLPIAGAAVSITVESSGAGAQLSKATPTVERRVGQQTLEALPLTGSRELSELALLAPGVSHTGYDGAGSVTYSATGQRQFSNGILLDGVDNKDSQYQFVHHSNFPEAIGEVQIQTNSFSAEFGRYLGAQISIVTRGGTNRFRGETWDYYGSNWTSAATLANKRAGLIAVRSSDHQAGGSFGGPIRKERTFFFGLIQASPHAEGPSANGLPTVTIPTPAGLAALARAPLGPGQTTESRQAVLSALAFLPDIHSEIRRYEGISSTPINGVPVEMGTARIPQSRPFSSWRVVGRVDHHFNSKDVLSYRFSLDRQDAPVAVGWPFSNNAFGQRFTSYEANRGQLHALTHTRVFRPSLVNELRLSSNRRRNDVVENQNALDMPRTTVNGFFTLGPAAFSPFIRPSNSYGAQNVLTWTRGRHSAKVGGDVLLIGDTISSTKQDQWTFTNFADFVNNRPNTLALRLKTSSEPFRSLHQSYFVQDDYKVRPGLTLNFGLRYQTANIPSGLFGAVTPEVAAAGVPARPRPDRNDWAPRGGFAYSPKGRAGWRSLLLGDATTVIRGGFGVGYGVVYEGEQGGSTLDLVNNYPWNLATTRNAPEIANSYPAGLATMPLAPGFSPLANFINYAEDAKNPTTHFYTFSVQREIRRSYILEFGYMGNRAYHLNQRKSSNPSVLMPEQAQRVIATRNTGSIPTPAQRRVNPQWGTRTRLELVGASNYNAGYVKFDRRLVKGLLIGANYTWSASLGDSDAGARLQDDNNRRLDYARNGNDLPHRFVVHYVWQTPGKRFWGGWRLSGVSQWQSGRPFGITTGVDSNGDGTTGYDRPNYNPGGVLRLDPVTGDWRSFSTPMDGGGVFVTPLNTTGAPLLYSMPFGGNLGRNTVRGPGFALWNMSVMKPFTITERIRLELRADSTNLFNHRNFGPPNASMNSPNFGRNESNPPSRLILLGVKIRF